MRRTALFPLLFLFSVILLLSGCKPSVPRKFIQPGKMEDILYDYHIAEAMATDYENRNDSLLTRVYKLAVLKKHGYTEAEFDSSMVYYMRHTERLHKIYESLSTRLGKTAISLGASESEVNRFNTLSSTGDTANIWNGDVSFVLMHHPAFNKYSFAVEADTTFHAGDKLMLQFDSQFIFQDGTRNGIVVMAMRLADDSVIVRNIHVSNSNRQKMEIQDINRVGIKEVKGFFLLNNSLNRAIENQTTLKLMIVNHIALVRMHTPEPEPSVNEEQKDTNVQPLPSPAHADEKPSPVHADEKPSAASPSLGPKIPHEPTLRQQPAFREMKVEKKPLNVQ